MTLLLTFFILLFAISEIKERKIYEVFKSFRTHFNIDVPHMGYHVEQLSDVVNMLSEMALELPDQKKGTEGKVRVENPFGDYAEVVKIRDHVLIQVEGRVLFAEHSAELKDEGRDTLRRVRDKLAGFPNRIRIVGHASPVPLGASSPYRDHYDLGYQRARAVCFFLSGEDLGERGILEERFEVSSRGALDLIPGVNLFDREDRARLSRVEIIVTPEKAVSASRGQEF